MMVWYRWLVTTSPPGESCTGVGIPIRRYGLSAGLVCFATPAAWTKERERMKRTQVAALVAGTALGLAGVTLGVVLSRKEGRAATRKLLGKTSTMAEQA